MTLTELKIKRNELLHQFNKAMKEAKWVHKVEDIEAVIITLNEIKWQIKEVDHDIFFYNAPKE